MFKRVLLSLTFIAALAAASLGMNSKAVAHDCGYGGYGYGGYNYGGYGYSTYYPAYGYGYAPRVSYYRAVPYGYRSNNWDDRNYGHRHHDHGGLHFSIGF